MKNCWLINRRRYSRRRRDYICAKHSARWRSDLCRDTLLTRIEHIVIYEQLLRTLIAPILFCAARISLRHFNEGRFRWHLVNNTASQQTRSNPHTCTPNIHTDTTSVGIILSFIWSYHAIASGCCLIPFWICPFEDLKKIIWVNNLQKF